MHWLSSNITVSQKNSAKHWKTPELAIALTAHLTCESHGCWLRAGACDGAPGRRRGRCAGLDLSPEMVAEARRRHPGVRFEVGDLRQLMRPATAAGWGAVLGWYSLIHLAASELPGAVAALARPLAPGGLLVLLHAGADVRRVSSWFETEVPPLDIVLHDPPTVIAVTAAGLTDVEWYLRGPHERRDETTQRLYVLARRV
jgi:uncharacterized protein